ncbi:energy transducer TonB [Croceibacterium ferulae]|uniref:energy transducer TonB n=1 Tax=Croceibacterium ferulae TaxID=1854641 RepID=UPI000EABD2AF|nr:energy transducer TonB [Croceibacterium ferulae]
MAYADQQMSGSRMVAIVIVVLIHLAIGYALITGLAYSAVKSVVERVTTVDIEEPPPPPEEEPPPPPPDEPVPVTSPPPVAPAPPVNIAPAPPPINTSTIIPPPAPPTRIVPPAAPPGPPTPPAPPAAPSRARGATPDGQGRWAARIQENYPSRAIRDEIEGRVGVRVQIGANGRVTACTVTNSSGSSVLDEAGCEGMTRYARYNPALDDAGNPTTGSASTTIVYQLDR